MSSANSPAAEGPLPGEPPEVSEEQFREYLKTLRSVPAEQVVAEIIFGVLNAAQAKLGRRDGRLLIDLSAVMHEHVRRYVSAELTTQVDQILGQLRLAQVRAEGVAAGEGKAEANDLAAPPAPPAAAGQPSTPPPPPSPSPASKLWVPGQNR